MVSCSSDCACGRHKKGIIRAFRPRSKCPADCVCGRHVRLPEVGIRIAAGLRGQAKGADHRRKISTSMRGRELSAEHRDNISLGLARRTPWNQKSTAAKHVWARRYLVKTPGCEECGSPQNLEWASVGHGYTQQRADWRWLCRRCHLQMDEKRGFCRKRRDA